MALKLPSIPYPEAGEGYWSPVTSTINWCEEDYYATKYSAEIVNTLTNLIFMVLAVRGIKNCIHHGHDMVFVVTFVGYFMVGTGSFCFHSTLKYPMQLVDELSMIYTTSLNCYATFSHKQSRRYAIGLATGLVALNLFITLYYHYLQDPRFHQAMYTLLTAIVLSRSIYIMRVNMRPALQSNEPKSTPQTAAGSNGAAAKEQDGRDRRDLNNLTMMRTLMAVGLSIFLGGFVFWQLDNTYCTTFRAWRRSIGLPWGILLEGHGWWHMMTGVGAYYYLTWGIWLRHSLNGRLDEYELSWPSTFTSIPFIVRRQARNTPALDGQTSTGRNYSNGNGISNGHGKKKQ